MSQCQPSSTRLDVIMYFCKFNLASSTVVAQALCIIIINLSLAQNTCLFTNGSDASVFVLAIQ